MDQQMIAELWRRKIRGITFDPPIDYKLVFNEVLRSIAKSNYSLLDIGTGAGKVIFKDDLYKLYGKTVGIDIRQEMIDICKAAAKEMKNVDFKVMDSMSKTSFNDGSFDVISSMFSPYDPSEVHRLLSPGGYLVTIGSLRGDHSEVAKVFPEFTQFPDGKPRLESLKQMNGTLRAKGFRVVSNNVLKYKWIFKDEEVLKQFYEKILFEPVFEGREDRLEKLKRFIDGSIPVTRVMCTTVARKA